MSSVAYDSDSRTWLLSTPASSYALRLDDTDTPRHVHWGRPVTLEAAGSLALPVPPLVSSFDGATDGDVELSVEGGAVFGVAGLMVRYADGSAGVEWRYVDHVMDRDLLEITLEDRHYPLRITLHYKVFDDSDVIERWITLRHTGTEAPIELRRCDSAQFVVPVLPDYRVSHVFGGWSREFQLERSVVPVGETVFTSRRGTTSHQANPWVMVDGGDALESSGEVWGAALAWSGSWRITVSRTPGGRLSWTGGFGHDGVGWRLRPGEEWTTPAFHGLYTVDGFGGASRRWHAFVRDHVLPTSEARPILYNSWEATGFDVTESGQQRLAELAAGLGVEVFVMDDGWFGGRRGDNAGLGDWHPSPSRFPRGLAPLIDAVRALGMRFGIWVEPEMVNPDSDLYREHPDWVLHLPSRRRTELRNQLVLNLARDDVAEWAYGWLTRLVAPGPPGARRSR
jgi:alpha-galactosidase